ncbi:hypothetical protein BaRGS_00015309 [Batillaria attramentaria]|uniref:MOSC domain-containing protein n=1 Tax=Batillaria attramentaria TaxID=370345 RepID=A0ABD0L1M0_9CAEN
MEKVGTVTQLNGYPIKSCSGIPVDSALCTPLGLKIGKSTDRHWLMVRANGDFVTQRQYSKMALITPEVRETELAINAPGMPTLTVPLEPASDKSKAMKCRVWAEKIEGLDCGDEAANWFSTFLKVEGLRLLFSAADLPRQDVTRNKKPDNPAKPGDETAFSDFSSYLVTTEESLAAVNERLKEPVVMRRFRPNIVVSGSPAFDEDNWLELKIGEATCLLTTVNPDTGERGSSEPLETLKSFRCFPKFGTSPLFGVHATVDNSGVVKVGDAVYAKKK